MVKSTSKWKYRDEQLSDVRKGLEETGTHLDEPRCLLKEALKMLSHHLEFKGRDTMMRLEFPIFCHRKV